MGASPSKRVQQTLENSQPFNTACSTAFTESITLTQHTVDGLLPYQLHPASLRLHQSLLTSCNLIQKWAPSPPSHLHVDNAYRSLIRRQEVQESLGEDQFRDFAVELFGNVVVENAGKAVLGRVPVGVVGIAGVGMVGKVGGGAIGAVIGAYAIGVATSIYISLG